MDLFSGERGPFQILFGDDASLPAEIVIPVVGAVFIFLVVLAMRFILTDKGKSEMTEEELAADRAAFDARMQREADYKGVEYLPEKAREMEEEDMALARRMAGKTDK